MPFEAIIGALIIFALIILFFLVKRIQDTNIKNELKEINVRFNAIKSIPLAFKLNKATYIAKINEEAAALVEKYRDKFDTCQKNIEQLQGLIDGIEDDVATKKTKQAKEAILIVKENLSDSEEEVKEIEEFLDSITQREHIQREYSNQLKEEYRELKQHIAYTANDLSLALDGIEIKLKECEDLFSSFEEQIYANEFVKAQEDLETINLNLKKIKLSVDEVPSLVHNAKGIIPTLIDELNRSYALTRQRGVYTAHLLIEDKIKEIELSLNQNLKDIISAETDGVGDRLEYVIASLKKILDSLKDENDAFTFLKKNLDSIKNSIKFLDKTYYYIEKVYNDDKAKYALENLEDIILNKNKYLDEFNFKYNDINTKLEKIEVPATTLMKDISELLSEIEKNKEVLLVTKNRIDKTSNDENRAQTQVVKLQIVLNEVEVKIAQYRLPAISDSYKEDLKNGHDLVKAIKNELNLIPLNIDNLNKKLDEAIDYIYKLYNNVNNVVGMALMVENAIIFGNKYRSSYPEVDIEMSKAEFAYLNGEYTQSLTIAIACIEKLFPKNGDDKIMEYATGVK